MANCFVQTINQRPHSAAFKAYPGKIFSFLPVMTPEPLTPRAAKLLAAYDYPGNVRELRSLVFAAMAEVGMSALERKTAELAGVDLGNPVATQPGFRPETDTWHYPDPLPTLELFLQPHPPTFNLKSIEKRSWTANPSRAWAVVNLTSSQWP